MICSAVSSPKSAGPSRPGKAAPAEEGPDKSQCAPWARRTHPQTRIWTAGTHISAGALPSVWHSSVSFSTENVSLGE